MKYLSNLILFLLILNFIDKQNAEVAKTAEIVECPKFCFCDLYFRLNRANCGSRHLTVEEVAEIPLEVEILDLSHNNVFNLDKDIFENFVFLKNLTISHNYIGSIHHEAFIPLRSITTIDLSHNGLEHVDDRIIKTNRKLQRLNLSDNKFKTLRNKPLLRSPWLRSLNLRNAKITNLYPDIFIALPNLRELDLSGNHMMAFNIAAFRAQKRLDFVNLNGSFWACNPNILKVVKLLQKRDIKVESEECDKVMQAGALEKTENENTVGSNNNESVDAVFGRTWHHMSPQDIESIDDDKSDTGPNELELVTDKIVCEFVETEKIADCNASPEELCYKYRKCLKDKIHGKKIESGNDLYFIFLIGFAMGVIFVVCLISFGMCLKRWFMARRKKRDTTAEPITEPEVFQTARPLIRRTNPTLVEAQIAPTIQAAPTTQVSSSAPSSQVPNQRRANTPTSLINLFNNPLSQHVSEERNVQQNRGPIPSAPSFSNQEHSEQIATPRSQPDERSVISTSAQVTAETQQTATAAKNLSKSDSPPPSYTESMSYIKK